MAKFGYALILLGWMVVISFFSSQTYESQDLRPWLGKALSRIDLESRLSWVRFHYAGREISIRELGEGGFAEFIVRKAAHLFEYAVLGCLLALALRTVIRRKRYLLPLSLFLSFTFALGDEYHQSFVDGRTPLAADALLDTCGAAFGILLCLLALRIVGRLSRSFGRPKVNSG